MCKKCPRLCKNEQKCQILHQKKQKHLKIALKTNKNLHSSEKLAQAARPLRPPFSISGGCYHCGPQYFKTKSQFRGAEGGQGVKYVRKKNQCVCVCPMLISLKNKVTSGGNLGILM